MAESPTLAGRNSKYIKNSVLSPAKLTMLAHQGLYPYSVEFDIVAREGQFSDTTIANYSSRGQSSLKKFLLNEAAKVSSLYFIKGELTTQYEGVTPKNIGFDIIFRADEDFPAEEIRRRVMILQSMCYPRGIIGLNPPLCMLSILNLYCLEVYVQQVLVNWHNQWDMSSGLPMGCDISVSCLMHQYPTREEILAGAGFDSTDFVSNGYSASFQDGKLTLTHGAESVRRIMAKDRAYAAANPGPVLPFS